MDRHVHVQYLDEAVVGSFQPGTAHAAGYDLAAAYQDYQIEPGKNVTVECGIKVAMYEGIYGRVVMRSGVGFKSDLSCHIGTVDSDYRGPIRVRVRNHGDKVVTIRQGDRFAQMIFQAHERPQILPVDEGVFANLTTARGEAGFGSTGR